MFRSLALLPTRVSGVKCVPREESLARSKAAVTVGAVFHYGDGAEHALVGDGGTMWRNVRKIATCTLVLLLALPTVVQECLVWTQRRHLPGRCVLARAVRYALMQLLHNCCRYLL